MSRLHLLNDAFGPQTDHFRIPCLFPAQAPPPWGLGKEILLIQTHQDSEHYTTICSDNILHIHGVWFQSQHHLRATLDPSKVLLNGRILHFAFQLFFYWKHSCENTKVKGLSLSFKAAKPSQTHQAHFPTPASSLPPALYGPDSISSLLSREHVPANQQQGQSTSFPI